MVDINNTLGPELSNNLRELTCSQKQQWHDSIWPCLSESLPDGRLSVNSTAEGGKEGGREGQETEKRRVYETMASQGKLECTN